LTFDLILVDGQGLAMDYLCAKFTDFSFNRFGFIVRTDRQNQKQRQTNAITASRDLRSALVCYIHCIVGDVVVVQCV